MKTSSAIKETEDEFEFEDEDDAGNDCEKESRNLIEAPRVTHSLPPIVLVLELVLDPSVDFSSNLHAFTRAVLLNSEF
jgi:hypothetical protein